MMWEYRSYIRNWGIMLIERIYLVLVAFLLISPTSLAETAEEYLAKGIEKAEAGEYRGAIEDFSKVIELNPNYAEAYLLRGTSKAGLGDYRGAIQDYNKSVELNPSDAFAYRGRGMSKLELGQKNDGCLDLSKAGELGDLEAYDYIKEYCQ